MGEARKFLQKLQVTKDTNKLLEEMKTPIAITDSGDGMYIPNHSGQHDAGTTGTPTEERDLVNKEYVDSVAGRGSMDLFLTENASDIGTYFDLEVDVVTAAKENIVQSITAGSTTLIGSFVSILNNSTINDITLLESGIYNMHIHAEGANAKNLFVYFEFYHRTAGGTETLLGTSHDSGELTTSEADYDLHSIIEDEKAFVSGDRIVVKVYGRNDSATARNVTIYMEGDTAARVEFPALLNVQTVLWEVDGTETQLKTADEIDMQTKKIINVVDPTANQEVATKKYVDDSTFWDRAATTLSPTTAGDNIETTGTGTFEGLTPYNNGTADLGSVGFKWRSLFLSADATVGGNITVGGTVDGIDIATDVAANTLKDTNVTTNLSAGTLTATTIDVNSSDGTNATLVEADTTNAGILGSDKWDEIVAATTHVADNTQAHSDYLLNSGVDIGVGLTLTGDNASVDTAYVPMVLYNTDATPPTASGFPIGTLYVQYTA